MPITPGSRRNSDFKRRYGISIPDYDAMYDLQQGLCKICLKAGERYKGLFVDHCHKTREIRGLLCHRCNSLLGHAKDSIDTLANAISYLQQRNGVLL